MERRPARFINPRPAALSAALLFAAMMLAFSALHAPVVLSDTLTSREWPVGPVLDQGQHPTCVGAAWQAWEEAGPLPYYRPAPLDWVYDHANQTDQWAPEEHDGTSVEAAAQVLQDYGAISSFSTSRDLEEVRAFIELTGPVVLATPVLTRMEWTMPDGYWIPRGYIEGYHAVLCYGWLSPDVGARGDSFECQNSWGSGWGKDGGRMLIHDRDLGYLFRHEAYAVLPVKIDESLSSLIYASW